VINMLRSNRQLKILLNIMFTRKQKLLTKFQQRYIIETESS